MARCGAGINIWQVAEMRRFYFDKNEMYGDMIRITGNDVNHIKNVLRMQTGERVVANDKEVNDYYCVIEDIDSEQVLLRIESFRKCSAELKTKLYLFQALPKQDKMEFIVQKAVELGAHEVIPVASSRCVVKLDDKKRQGKKLARWQTIAESAAKQSARGIIPKVNSIMSFKQAIDYAEKLERSIIPYEHAKGMDKSRQYMDEAAECESVGIFIGPEGGFEESEIQYACEHGIKPVSLGNRILRTETAGLCVLSILMFKISE